MMKPSIKSHHQVSQKFFLILLCCCIIRQPVFTQKHTSSGSQDPNNGQQQVNAHKSLHKIGLAPHDRPACHLTSIGPQRRHQVLSEQETNQSINLNTSRFSPKQDTLEIPMVQSGSSMRRFDSSERLRQLRQLMSSNNYDAYLVTSSDEHGTAYTSDYDRRLRFISGFTGSNGYALILLDRAVLFTDGRYQIQADQDLDCNWWLVVSNDPLVDIPLWLKANAAKGIKVATDARLMSLQTFDFLEEQTRKLDSEFVLISQDLVDSVWNNFPDSGSRLPPQDSLFVHPTQFTGNQSWQDKVVRLADSMSKMKARHYLMSQLDDIAWLLNLRGNDIPMSPMFKAYVLISCSLDASQRRIPTSMPQIGSVEQLLTGNSFQQHLQAPQVLQVEPGQTIKLTVYVDLKKVSSQVRAHLQVDNGSLVIHQASQLNKSPMDWLESSREEISSTGSVSTRIQVELKDYDVFIMDIRDKLTPASGPRHLQGKLLLDAASNVAIHVLAKGYDERLVLLESLVGKMKAIKSDTEVQGMRSAHYRDSLAISMLLAQLEADIGTKGLTGKWTETGAASELDLYRSLMDYNKGNSFETISAYGSNGAIIHYNPNENGVTRIGNQSTYLLDTGGQYLDGTTDITRTTHYGEPTEFQRETYTRVLMGAIDMMSLIFDGSSRSAYRINDLIARRHLFELGLDYAHGTGHGIGLFSMVHEAPNLLVQYSSGGGPVRASSEAKQTSGQTQASVHSEPVPLQANMFTSVEPGYYKANDFGIRLENIVVTQRIHLASGISRPNDRQEAAVKTGEQRHFLRFEPISLVPFEPKLIKTELMSNKQKSWLNSYNILVRLKMTQQINYYLSKIRNLGAVTVAQEGSSVSNKSDSQMDLSYYNFRRMDGARLEEKLEQTHKWIMSKTELLPLDVPQVLVSGQPCAGGHTSRWAQLGRRRDPEPSGLDGQKLVLAYMSQLPFNDAEALDAASSLAQLSERAVSNGSVKCSGLECDLWMVGALSADRLLAKSGGQHQERQQSWTEMVNEELLSDSVSLSELFRLSGSGSGSVSLNMWTLVALGLVVAVQLGVISYMCSRRLSETRELVPGGAQ